MLETSVASVNSALQRAHAGMKQHLPERRLEWAPEVDPTVAERELVQRYVALNESADARGFAEILHEDVRFSMPPDPRVWDGRDSVIQSWIVGGFGTDIFGSIRCSVTHANRQPAVAAWVRKPGDTAYTPLAIDVLRIQDGLVADIVTFGAPVFESFGLPRTV